jgi:hypothetical protein
MMKIPCFTREIVMYKGSPGHLLPQELTNQLIHSCPVLRGSSTGVHIYQMPATRSLPRHLRP